MTLTSEHTGLWPDFAGAERSAAWPQVGHPSWTRMLAAIVVLCALTLSILASILVTPGERSVARGVAGPATLGTGTSNSGDPHC